MTIAFTFYILHSGGQWSHDFKFSSGNSCNIATSNTVAAFRIATSGNKFILRQYFDFAKGT